MNNTSKQRIAAAFSAAAPGYDAVALVQRRAAARLTETICAAAPAPGGLRLEIGCGTGLLTARLLDRLPGDWLITDIAPAMVDSCAAAVGRARARFRVMDGEAPDVAPCRLIVSSLAFQWFDDLAASLPRLIDRLEPGGRLAFATLGAATFGEWRAAHDDLGLACGARAFPSAAALRRLWPAGGIGTVRGERIAVRHADGLAFVRGLAALGANVPTPGHRPLGPGDFRRLLRRFDGGCTATYQILYGDYVRETP